MLWKEAFEELFGSRPTVPKIEKLSLGDEQQQAIKDNIAAAPEASKLANLTMDQIMSMLSRVDPGFQGKADKISSNIDDMLAGKIPQDVTEAVQRSSATQSLTGGYSGSEMGRNLTARDLGLTSLDLTGKGLSQAESWLGSVERLLSPAMSTFTGMFVTPMQEYSTHNEQNVQQFQREWLRNQVQAMPDPVIRGIQDTVMQLSGRGGQPQSGNQYSNLGGPGTKDYNSSGNDWSSGWQSSGPITSPGMSYDEPGVIEATSFGSEIKAPSMYL